MSDAGAGTAWTPVTSGLSAMLAGDHHVHSTYSDGVSTIEENIEAARARGVRTLCLVDHVRTGSTWVPEFVKAVRAADPGRAQLRIMCGVEAKILDRTGRLDLPGWLSGLDRLLIADHQFPGESGPVAPEAVREQLRAGALAPTQVVDALVLATANAMRLAPPIAQPQVAHLFSLLPKVGLTEAEVSGDQLAFLAETARAIGALVEVNEKWGCPGPAALAAFMAAGVPVIASTDSHHARDVGVYHRVPALLRAAGLTG